MPHRSARPYSLDMPLPPWVWMDWSRQPGGVGGRELGHVGGLAGFGGVPGEVAKPGRLVGHQPGQFDIDLGFGQRMGDPW